MGLNQQDEATGHGDLAHVMSVPALIAHATPGLCRSAVGGGTTCRRRGTAGAAEIPRFLASSPHLL
jgi:hypothetical protein